MFFESRKTGNDKRHEESGNRIRYSGFTYYEYTRSGQVIIWSGRRIYII